MGNLFGSRVPIVQLGGDSNEVYHRVVGFFVVVVVDEIIGSLRKRSSCSHFTFQVRIGLV